MHKVSSRGPSVIVRRLSGIGTVAQWVWAATVLAQPAPPARAILRLDGAAVPTPQVDSVVTRLMDAAHVTGVGLAIFHDGSASDLRAYGHCDVGMGLALTPNSVMTSASLSKAAFATGSRYAYSGEGIDLAQFVVETVTGKSATALMRETLFGPLGMTRSSMIREPQFASDFANGYDEYGRSLGPEEWSRPDAAGSMQTTLADYATFLAAVLQRCVIDGRTTGEMFRPQIAIHSAHQFPSLARDSTQANHAIALSYGLGWGVYATPLGRAYFREGHDVGWRHLPLLFDSTRSGILIMTNSGNGEGIFKPLLDSLLGPTSFPFEWEGYTPYTDLPPLPKLKQHTRVSLSPDQLKEFAGRYALSPQVVLTVTVDGSRLFVQEGDEPKQQLLAQSLRGFFSTASDDEYTFSPASGQARVMVLHVGGKDIRLSRIK